MRNKHDFSKAIKNLYAKTLKKPISIRIDEDVIAYFKKIADDVGVSYQVLMNLYLRQVKNEELMPRFVQEAKLPIEEKQQHE
ncbi:MAG: BrnA antitoxin family protein [Smithellaceae bacterium]|nr:BrnA antitoxin family protein [Smithellaceae bacterium]